MLSYPALSKLHDQLKSTASSVLKSNDQEVINLINRLEKKMTQMKEQYEQYCEIESQYINMYYHLKSEYTSSSKFSINSIEDDLKEYDKAYQDCEEFRNLYEDLCINAENCHLLDLDNENLTNDEEKNIKYRKWFEEIDTFQKEIHDEIQYQINENETEFYDTVELIKTKLYEEDEEEFRTKLYEENEKELSQFEEIKEK